MFGTGNSTSNSQSNNLFGQPKPGGSIFGNNSSGNSIFGSAATSAAPATSGTSSTTPGSATLLGTAATTATQPSGTTPAPGGSGSSVFGGGSAFGSKPAATGATTSSSVFGSTPSLGASNPTPSATGQAPAAAPAAQPTGSALFGSFGTKPAGSTTATAPSTTAPATTASGGLFGTKPVSATPASGSVFGSTSTTTPATNASANQTSAPQGGGLFSSFSAKPAEKKDTPAPAAAPSGTTQTAGLFGTSKPEEKKDATSTAAPPATTSIFGAPKENTAATTTTSALATHAITLGGQTPQAPAAASNIAVPPPSMLRGKTIEEIVNRWTTELETQVKEFNRFANEVAVWDRALAENGNNLAALNSYVLAAEREQSEIEQSLNHIEDQQKSLSATLDAYEKSTQEIMSQSGLRALDTGPADTERDKNYMLATELHTQLDDLAASLSQMIDSVNSLSSPGNDGGEDDPMVQIAQILNSHLESLQWIDGTAGEVEGKVSDIERRVRESGLASSSTGRAKAYGLKR